MAEIKFTGFVEEVLTGRTGPYGLKIAEGHSKKDENDQWVTVARTFHRVKSAYQAEIPFGSFNKGDRVDVAGKQVTETYEQNGERKYALVVKADSVAPVARGPQQAPQQSQQAEPWATPGSSSNGWDTSTEPF